LPANAEKVPLCTWAVVITGELFVPSMTHGGKLPVSKSPLTITLQTPLGLEMLESCDCPVREMFGNCV
jgi:hypothetical protein